MKAMAVDIIDDYPLNKIRRKSTLEKRRMVQGRGYGLGIF